MLPNALPTRRQALATVVLTGVTAAACGALVVAAAVARAPVGVLPFVALVSIACPMVMAWSVPTALAVLRARRAREREAVAALRRQLDGLPETQHPLGL